MATAKVTSSSRAVDKLAADGHTLQSPPLAALFLIKFDVKIGYTVAWKRSAPHVPVDGIVEYKSLPSGLHNVKQDLVYFSHEQYTGVSSFLQGEAAKLERNAKFVAVGALLPSNDGRLGRAWMHASNLTTFARQVLNDATDTGVLEEYWEQHKGSVADDNLSASAQLSPFSTAQQRHKTASSTTLVNENKQSLPYDHPVWSTIKFIKTFGPLIYPLHRAALLRKRILFITKAPIRRACEFVYVLSISSSTPSSLANSLFLPSESLIRLQPLFSIGVHDIPHLEHLAQKNDDESTTCPGWIACSTDEILATKTKLYDILVEMSNENEGTSIKKRPVLRSASGPIKATHRDLRRWRMLERIIDVWERSKDDLNTEYDDDILHEDLPLLAQPSSAILGSQAEKDIENEESAVLEGTSWTELAYSSFLWWASAGEQDDFLVEEDGHDRSALVDVMKVVEQIIDERSHNEDQVSTTKEITSNRLDARIEVALISYFHGLTRTLFEAATDIFGDDDAESTSSTDEVTHIGREELRQLGLDAWSKSDKEFIKSFTSLWYTKDIKVDAIGVECCGIQIC